MPICELTAELVQQIINSYGQIRKLNLSTNAISRVKNLERLSCLTKLNLSANRLGQAPESLSGLSRLTCLRELDLSDNGITTLQPLSVASTSLERLNVANNEIVQVDQVVFLASLTALTELVLTGNPVSKKGDHRRRVLELLPSLEALDHRPRAKEESPSIDRESRQSPPQDAAYAGFIGGQIPDSSPLKGVEYVSSDSGDESVQSDTAPRPKPIRGGDSPGSSQESFAGAGYQGWVSEDKSDVAWTPDEVKSGPGSRLVRTSARSEEWVVGAASVAGEAITGVESPRLSKASFSPRSESAEQTAVSALSSSSQEDREPLSLLPTAPGGVEKRTGATTAVARWLAPEVKGRSIVTQPRNAPNGREGFHSEVKAAGKGHSRATSTDFSLVKKHTAMPSRSAVGEVALPTMLDGDVSFGSVRTDREQVSEAKPLGVHDAGWLDKHTRVNPPTASIDEGPIIAEASAGTLVLTDEGWVSNATRPAAMGLPQSTPCQGQYTVFSSASFASSMSKSTADGKAAPTDPDKNGSSSPNLTDGAGGGSRSWPGQMVKTPPERSGLVPADALLRRQGTAQVSSFASGGPWQIQLGTDCSASSLPITPSSRLADAGRGSALVVDRRTDGTPTLDEYPRVSRQQDITTAAAAPSGDNRGRYDARRTDGEDAAERPTALNLSKTIRSNGTAALDAQDGDAHSSADVVEHTRQFGHSYSGSRNPFDDILLEPLLAQQQQRLDRVSAGNTHGNMLSEDGGLRNSLPRGWGTVRAPSPTLPADHRRADRSGDIADEELLAGVGRRPRNDHGGESGPRVVMVDGREWDELKRENDALRRHADLAEKRCSALVEMQHLADKALARKYSSRFPTAGTESTAAGLGANKKPSSQKHGDAATASDNDKDSGEANGDDKRDEVSDLLALWRFEVLKLLLQRREMEAAVAEDSRKAATRLREQRDARARAEADAKALTQRALAAEAEAELVGIKLERALQEARENRKRRCAAESKVSGHTIAVRELHGWLREFVGRACEGFYEREAVLARGVAKLEAFSQRVGLAAGRLDVVRTLLQRKEVQLRNSRAALAADRRVWLLERRQRELAALAKKHPQSSSNHPQPEQPCSRQRSYPTSHPIMLEGLRPECEAVMRALFCRVDRLGTGAVSARRLLSVLRSDCGVSELMEAAVGAHRWRGALDSMEARLCPPATNDDGSVGDDAVRAIDAGLWDDPGAAPPQAGNQSNDDCTVTWGEFLLFFLPSTGPTDDAYNAGLVSTDKRDPRGGFGRGSGGGGCRGGRQKTPISGTAMQDPIAMLQMVVPRHWAAGELSASCPAAAAAAEIGVLAALSVGQLRHEVRRLAKERGYLLWLVREDARLGVRRAEAVHDQYRHELRALHTAIGEVEDSLDEAVRRADEEQGRADSAREELSGLTEKMQQAEYDWQRKLDVAAQQHSSALEACSRDNATASTATRERLSRVEAEHALALRENGKASVRQRALERELARIKESLQTEARLEKEALEERLRAGEAKLTVAKRERNALLAALRDMQRNDRTWTGESQSPISNGIVQSTAASADASLGVGSGADVEVTAASDGQDNMACSVVGPTRKKGTVDDAVDADDRRGHGSVGVVEDCNGRNDNTYTEGGHFGPVTGKTFDVVRVGVSGDDGDSTKNASLAARLEMLAVQTRELLAEDSSWSSDDSES